MGIHNIIHDVDPSLQSDNLWRKETENSQWLSSMGKIIWGLLGKLKHNNKVNHF